MINFLKETLDELTKHGKTWANVLWIGDKRSMMSVSEFIKAADFDYRHEFTGDQIDPELLIVGDDWWMERDSYNGAEWWAFKSQPMCPEGKVYKFRRP